MVQANTNQRISDVRRNLIKSGLVGGVLLSTGCTDYIGTSTEKPDKPPTADPDPPKVCEDEFTPFERLDPGEHILPTDFDIMKDIADDFKQSHIQEFSTYYKITGVKPGEIDAGLETPIPFPLLELVYSIQISEKNASKLTDVMENNPEKVYKKAKFRIEYDGRDVPVASRGVETATPSGDKSDIKRYGVKLEVPLPYQVGDSDIYIPVSIFVRNVSKENCENAIRYASKHIANSLEPNKESTLDEKIMEFEQNNEHGWGGSSLL